MDTDPRTVLLRNSSAFMRQVATVLERMEVLEQRGQWTPPKLETAPRICDDGGPATARSKSGSLASTPPKRSRPSDSDQRNTSLTVHSTKP